MRCDSSGGGDFPEAGGGSREGMFGCLGACIVSFGCVYRQYSGDNAV